MHLKLGHIGCAKGGDEDGRIVADAVQPLVRGRGRAHPLVEQRALAAVVYRGAHALVQVGASAQHVREARRRRAVDGEPHRLAALADAHLHDASSRPLQALARSEQLGQITHQRGGPSLGLDDHLDRAPQAHAAVVGVHAAAAASVLVAEAPPALALALALALTTQLACRLPSWREPLHRLVAARVGPRRQRRRRLRLRRRGKRAHDERVELGLEPGWRRANDQAILEHFAPRVRVTRPAHRHGLLLLPRQLRRRGVTA